MVKKLKQVLFDKKIIMIDLQNTERYKKTQNSLNLSWIWHKYNFAHHPIYSPISTSRTETQESQISIR